MNLERIKQILKKVNALIENLDDQGQTSAIERDLLLRYLRDLYENVSESATISDVIPAGSDFIHSPLVARAEKKHVSNDSDLEDLGARHFQSETQDSVSKDTIVSKQPAVNLSEPVVQANLEQDQTTFYDAARSGNAPVEVPLPEVSNAAPPEEAVINKFENPVQYFPPKDEDVVTQTPSVQSEIGTTSPTPTVSTTETHSSTTVTLKNASDRFNRLFAEKSATDIADKYQLQKVVTIEGAMGINERMLTINELFGGDHNIFMETVTHINSLTDFDSSRKYLIEGVASKFNWDNDECLSLASDFVQLVRRKFA